MTEPNSELEFAWGRPKSFIAISLAATTSPRRFFAQAPRAGGLLAPGSFFLLTQLIPALLSLLLALAKGQDLASSLHGMAVSLGLSLGTALALALVLHLACRLLFVSSLTLEQTMRVVGYGFAPWTLFFLHLLLSPTAGALLVLLLVGYTLYILWIGLQEMGGLGAYQAALALALALALIVALRLWFWRQPLPQAAVPAPGGPAAPAP